MKKSQSNMDSTGGYTDKEVLTDALTMQKHMTGNVNTFSNECKNQDVRKTMLDILNDEHSIQFDIFNDMQAKGYYKTKPAAKDKVSEVKSTFAKQANSADTKTNTGQWHTKKDSE